MRKPVVLITVGVKNQAAAQGEIQGVITGCDINYANAVVRAGGAPVIVPRVADAEALQAIVQAADCLLLTGGGDINPLVYGEEPHIKTKYQDPIRDEMELIVTRLALERELPILGICRGHQLLNVALGGTLIQDIPTQVTDALNHDADPLEPTTIHSVDVVPDSLLARLLHTHAQSVNSYHHQAIKDLGRGLRVNCRAKDGVIEGIEAADGRPIMAIQYHPEELAGCDRQFQLCFDWLIGEGQRLP